MSSNHKTKIIQNSKKLLEFKKFKFNIEKELLKAENIFFNDNIKNSKELSNSLFFKDAFFDLKNKEFIAGKTKIQLQKDSFNNYDNDPRLEGASSSSNNGVTTIEKSTFTSCKKNDSCPAWSFKSEKITHDKIKRQIEYKNAVLKIKDFPVFYFPKFFHPDPTVKRQSGLLRPEFRSSKILGSSLNLPYFHVISDNKDLTFHPTLFKKDIFMIQNEYRQQNKDSRLEANFGFTDGYKSSLGIILLPISSEHFVSWKQMISGSCLSINVFRLQSKYSS